MLKKYNTQFFNSILLSAKYFIFFAFIIGISIQPFAGHCNYSVKKVNLLPVKRKFAAHYKNEHLVLNNFKTSKQLYSVLILKDIEGPSFTESYQFTISELTAIGTSVDTIIASDPDGDALTYTIEAGNTNSTFMLDSTTGILKTAKRLNYHTQALYSLLLKATDASGLSVETTIPITVEASTAVPTFTSLNWETAAGQPYIVSEQQGEMVDNKLYVFGGFDSQKPGFTPTDRAFVYDPCLNNWTALAPLPSMNNTSYGGVTHAGMTTDGTDIYFAGGYTSNFAGTGQIFGTKEAWKYIVAENRYERLPSLPIPIAAGRLEYLNGQLHHIGGTNQTRTKDLGDHYVLDLDNLATGWKTRASLPNPHQHAGSAVYESKIYYIGGQTGHDGKLVTQNEVQLYDPNTNTWTKKADLPVPVGSKGRGHISSSVIVAGNRILVLAGETVFNRGRTNLVSAYTPSTNTWENLTPLPQPRYSGVATFLNNAIFYTGGSRTNITFKGYPIFPPTQNLITNLTTNTNGIYRIGELVVGAALYTDRTHQVMKFPEYLNKALYISTPNNDKTQTGNEVFSFELTKNASLYVAYDPRATVLPAWLNDWQKLPDTLTINDPAIKKLNLYSKTVPADKVFLAGNLAAPATGALTNYIVIIIPTNTTSVNPEQEKEGMELKLYPNPNQVGNKIKLELNGLSAQELVTVTLHDMVGRLVSTYQMKATPERMSVLELKISQHLPAGIYLVKAQAKAGQAQVKLLIQ